MTGHKTGRVRLDRNHDWLAIEGYAEAEQYAAAISAKTGLDMLPRGLALVNHVSHGMKLGLPRDEIAKSVGYTTNRCAKRLAECGNAPLGRAYLNHQPVTRKKGKPPVSRDRRVLIPRTDLDAMADELLDLADAGVEWWEAAARVSPNSQARQLARRLAHGGHKSVLAKFRGVWAA